MWAKIRRYIIALLVIFEIAILTGGNSVDGRLYRWLGHPISNVLDHVAQMVGGVDAFGFAIIILTALLQLILLPIRFDMQKNTTENSEKMQRLQPQLSKVQEAAKAAKDPQEQMAIQQLMMGVYRENGVSLTGGMNFLTLLLQMPIFSGLYSAIVHSPMLKTATFFGIPLSKPSFLIATAAGLLYLAQAYLMYRNMSDEQKKNPMSKQMMLMSPIMIFIIANVSSAGLGLYFVVGGIFVLILSAAMLKIRPGIIAKVDREFKVVNIVDQKLKDITQNVSPAATAAVETTSTNQPTAKNRNSGKQNRK